MMRVLESFVSINGEGSQQGYPTLFIRFAGCNMRCEYCDTKWSWDHKAGKALDVEGIMNRVIRMTSKTGLNRITITGGEFLIQPTDEVVLLLEKLTRAGYDVEVETNGTIDIPYIGASNYGRSDVGSLVWTIDVKDYIANTNEAINSLPEDFQYSDSRWNTNIVLKYVLDNPNDIEMALENANKYTTHDSIREVIISTTENIERSKVVEAMMKYPDLKFQIQIHKIVWDPEKRGV